MPHLRGGGGSGAGPERLIKGGLPTEAMVASVLVSKYAWHLPLYRQAQMLAAQGLDIKRSMLAFWVGYAAAELRPVYERLRELILMSARSRSTRRGPRCSIQAEAGSRRAISGRSPATIDQGAARTLRPSPSPMHPAAGRSMA